MINLNPQQQEAIFYTTGPMLVLAGAGSGKTRVITEKIAHLISKGGYQPHQIAAVTFTNKAAREMQLRVQQRLGKSGARGLRISTFHTLGLNFIRQELAHLGYQEKFTLFDDQDTFALLNALTEPAFAGDKAKVQKLQYQIGHWKSAMLFPHMIQTETAEEQQLVDYYQQYQAHLKSYNAVDFDDLILLPTQLLATNEPVRQKWQQRIRYLLVDEYQDTNTSQYQLVKLLVGEQARFTVVGDDDQSIYSWRGAQPENLALLKKDFPNLKVTLLETNYRSVGRILKAANILIENNEHIFNKKLVSNREQGNPLRVIYGNHTEHEAERVVSEIIQGHLIQGRLYGQYAILYRSNHQARPFEQLLMKSRIPYKLSGGQSFFARAEIKDLLAYFRLVVNPDDDNAFLRIINLPRRGLGPTTLKRIGDFAQENKMSLFAACEHLGLKTQLSTSAYQALQAFVMLIHKAQKQATGDVPDAIEAVQTIYNDTDYEAYLFAESTSPAAAEIRVKNIHELYRWITSMLKGDQEHEPMSLEQVVTRLALRDMLSRDENSDQDNQVQLMTLHASKGLEFPFVYLVGMEEGILPHQASIDLDCQDAIAEERRLAYVGITRAQEALTFTSARTRKQQGTTIRPEISRFIHELPLEDLNWEGKAPLNPEKSAQERRQFGIELMQQLEKKLNQNTKL